MLRAWQFRINDISSGLIICIFFHLVRIIWEKRIVIIRKKHDYAKKQKEKRHDGGKEQKEKKHDYAKSKKSRIGD